MEWASLYGQDRQPSPSEIAAYIDNPVWADLGRFLSEGYGVEPIYSYSTCSGQPGWNVKYKKGGRALCTLYPMAGYFIALVVIGTNEEVQAELLMPFCSAYTQELFRHTAFGVGGRWLAIHVADAAVLEDTKRLIEVRRPIRRKP